MKVDSVAKSNDFAVAQKNNKIEVPSFFSLITMTDNVQELQKTLKLTFEAEKIASKQVDDLKKKYAEYEVAYLMPMSLDDNFYCRIKWRIQ